MYSASNPSNIDTPIPKSPRGSYTEQASSTTTVFKGAPVQLDFGLTLQETLNLVRSHKPQNSKIQQLKQSLGFSQQSTCEEDLQYQLCQEVKTLIKSYETRLSAQCQMQDRVNQASIQQQINEKQQLREQLLIEVQSQNEVQISKQVEILASEMKAQYKSKIKELKSKHKTKLKEQRESLSLKHLEELSKVEQRVEQALNEQYQDEIERLQAQLSEQHLAELEKMQDCIDQLQLELSNAVSAAEQLMELKYQQRLDLVRKMHEEEVYEIKKSSKEQQKQLEQIAANLVQEREALIQKAQNEARLEERKKRANFQAKLEAIKRAEIDEIKKQSSEQSFYLANLASSQSALKCSKSQILDGFIGSSLSQSQMPLQNRMQRMKESLVGARLSKSKESGNEKSQSIQDSTFSFDQLKSSDLTELGKCSEHVREPQIISVNNVKKDPADVKTNTREVTPNKTREVTPKKTKPIDETVQCDLSAQYFDPLDMRKCVRCGLNDKKAPQLCRHHPARQSKADKYTSEYHLCHEQCDSKSIGCKRSHKHIYPEYQPKTYQKYTVFSTTRKTQQVMTDVSLLNVSIERRDRSPTPRIDEMMRRSNLSLSQLKESSKSPARKSCLKSSQSPKNTQGKHAKFNLEDLASSVSSFI